MRQFFLLLVLAISFVSCSKEVKKEPEPNLTIYIDAIQRIDSIFISNMTQDRDFFMLPFQDTIQVTLKDSINDLYNVWIFSEGKQYSRAANQFWLSGEKITIKGTFDNGFVLDTLIGSELYYKSLDFQKQYSQLFREKKSSDEIDDFLLNFTKKNLNTILSFSSSDNYLFKNGNDLSKVRRLQEIIKDQDPALRNHMVFNAHQKIEKLLSLKTINIGKYDFTDVSGKPTKIALESNKKYLLDLWFVNCPPCIKDHKSFLENPSLLADHGIEMIGISRDHEQKTWAQFVKDKSYPWKNYRQSNLEGSMTEDLLIKIFPTYYLVEGDGTLLASFNGYQDVKKYLTK